MKKKTRARRNTNPLHYTSGAFIGTSITLGVRPGVVAAQALPNLVGVLKHYIPCTNSGIGGNTSPQMLARYETDVLAYSPGMISIEAGTNEPGSNIRVGAIGATGSFTDNIYQMIVKGQRIGAKITLWVSILAQDPSLDASIAPYRTAMRQLAASQGCFTFDTYADMVALPSATQNSYFIDSPGQHLSPLGLTWAAGLVGSGTYTNSFVGAVAPSD